MGRPQDRIPKNSLFAVSVEAAGFLEEEICDKPQHHITAEVEDRQYHAVLLRSALRCVGQQDIPIPIVAILSTDRLSQHFVALPAGAKTTIDSASFHECWAT
jgi:hypothetical protein